MKKLSRLALPAIIVAAVSLMTAVPAQAGCGVPYDTATYNSCMAEPGNDGSTGWQVRKSSPFPVRLHRFEGVRLAGVGCGGVYARKS
jgi:hypothetical protein